MAFSFSVCACCQAPLDDTVPNERQEALVVDFRAGFASLFGEGNQVTGAFCQQCVRQLLGSYLTVTGLDESKYEPFPEILSGDDRLE